MSQWLYVGPYVENHFDIHSTSRRSTRVIRELDILFWPALSGNLPRDTLNVRSPIASVANSQQRSIFSCCSLRSAKQVRGRKALRTFEFDVMRQVIAVVETARKTTTVLCTLPAS